jgi:putative selenium metabolism hydrolase
MNIPFEQVNRSAEAYKAAISHFLREMIAIPSESGAEGKIIQRIRQEMESAGFDRVQIDPMGNILGYIGNGRHLIAMDAHIDTVGIGNLENWTYDPYQGHEDEDVIYGRGSSDQEGGMASMIYAGKIIKDLEIEGDFTLLITGTVQEEDCDGLCWQYIIEEDQIQPEFVVSSEPTSCRIHRGHRGRMEIKITVSGISAHGSAPERGDNAIFKMALILNELQQLNERLKYDPFLGKGTLTVSEIVSTSPSRCAVADNCTISVDRRLTTGETQKSAIEEIQRLPSVKKFDAAVSIYDYRRQSYTGLTYPTTCYFPTWTIDESHPVCRTLVDAYKSLFSEKPVVDKWSFSTNGVSIMGRYGIPCIGFGPGHEDQAHAPDERTWKSELVKAAAMYAVIPSIYVKKYAK